MAAILAAAENKSEAKEARQVDPLPDVLPDEGAIDRDDALAAEKESRQRQGRKPPKKPSPTRLRNQALHHISKFEVSAAGLKTVLMRKARRAAWYHDDIEDNDITDWIDQIILDFQEKGWVSDSRFAENRSRSLGRQGKSSRAIRQNLSAKGVGQQVIGDAMQALEAEESDLVRACRYVRKRRFAAYRPPEKRALRDEKDKAALLRAGFAFDIIDRIFACNTWEEIEALAEEESL